MTIGGIPGYNYGSDLIGQSHVLLDDLELIKKTATYGDEDDRYLRMAGEVLATQIDDVIEAWFAYFRSLPHLLAYFTDAKGEPVATYVSAVQRRFGQWILDTCNTPYDQDWLNYQNEIALRHSHARKNRTDNIQSAPEVHFRQIIASIYPFSAILHPFLKSAGHSAEDVEKMQQAWLKSLLIQVALWSQAYIQHGETK